MKIACLIEQSWLRITVKPMWGSRTLCLICKKTRIIAKQICFI